jgi:hypothetical protein
MTAVHPLPVRNAIATTVLARIDAGTGPGRLILTAADDTVVAMLTFAKPAFGTAVNGMAIANPINNDPSAAGGLASKCKIYDSAGNEVFEGSVTGPGGGGDIELNSASISPTQQVTLTSLTYTAPP